MSQSHLDPFRRVTERVDQFNEVFSAPEVCVVSNNSPLFVHKLLRIPFCEPVVNIPSLLHGITLNSLLTCIVSSPGEIAFQCVFF